MANNNETLGADTSENSESVEFDVTNLIAGLRDFLLRSVRENGMKKPWQKMSEGEQTLEIERATEKSEQIVRDIVDLVAQGDFPVIHATVDNFKIKAGEVTITAKGIAEDEVVLTLNRVGVKAVKIVVADVAQFDQRRSNLKADPDQPGLPGVKLELSAEEVNGTFEDADEPKPTDSDGNEFDDDAEQAEGAAALELAPQDPAPPAHGPITDMKGFPNGPMQAMRDGARWWSDDGLEWRAATDDDVLPADMDDQPQQPLEFDPNEALPGVDEVATDSLELDNSDHDQSQADLDDDAAGFEDPAPEMTEDPPAGGEAWPDDAAIEQRAADVAAEGGNADPGTGEVLPLHDAEADEIRRDGAKSRIDGKGPKVNPHPAKSERAKAWLEGYNAQKKSENDKPSGDAEFDS